MPAFATETSITPGNIRNVLVWLSQSNLTRFSNEGECIRSSLSERTLNNVESAVKLSAQNEVFLSFEEALDYQLLMPFNLCQQNDRRPFNPFYS